MRDKIIGILAVLLMIGFMAVVIVFVPSTDLMVIIALVVVLMCYDFYLMLFKGKV